jgi:hypothetical protein
MMYKVQKSSFTHYDAPSSENSKFRLIFTRNGKDEREILFHKYTISKFSSHLGGVAVSVLSTGPNGCGFEPGQGDGFLRAIKICSMPSSWMGSKAGRSRVVGFYGM